MGNGMFAGVVHRVISTTGRNSPSPSGGPHLHTIVRGTLSIGVAESAVGHTMTHNANNSSGSGVSRIDCRNCNINNITMLIRAVASGLGQAIDRMHRTFAGGSNGLNASNSITCLFAGHNRVAFGSADLRSRMVLITLSTNTLSVRGSNSDLLIVAR